MTDQMKITEFRQPALDAGDYTITASQTVTAREIDPVDAAPFKDALYFSVSGPRFSLDPQLIAEVFPPDGSLGDYSSVLPHIILTRSTLPWERSPGGPADPVAPWLALLLFTEKESDQFQICSMSLDELKLQRGACFPAGGAWPTTSDPCAGPYLAKETGDNDEDRLTVIQLSESLYQKAIIPPTLRQLSLLAHVRATTGTPGQPDEVAVIVGSRLPMAGGISTVHLVSVEGRYNSYGNFDYPTKDKVIRLVSLKSWRFACNKGGAGFKELVTALRRDTLRLPLLSSGSGTPASRIAVDANSYLAMGCAPLPHAMRQGNRSVSWYHGPLVPGPITIKDAAALPVHAADALVRYNQAYGMFDVSYAAAWQLGRLLALQSKSFSSSLYRWKRRHTAILSNARIATRNPQPQTLPPAPTDLPFPKDVDDWLERLGRLEGVPLRYLVPDEKMLPTESIRFFQMDSYWVKCLLDGAFSLGRALDSDDQNDAEIWTQHLAKHVPQQASGFLMRSEVVAGWPGLMTEGYDIPLKSNDPLPKKTLPWLSVSPTNPFVRLSDTVLLCLFTGLVQTVNLHLKPEALHFGLDESTVSINNDRILGLDKVTTDAATFAAKMIAKPDSVAFSAA